MSSRSALLLVDLTQCLGLYIELNERRRISSKGAKCIVAKYRKSVVTEIYNRPVSVESLKSINTINSYKHVLKSIGLLYLFRSLYSFPLSKCSESIACSRFNLDFAAFNKVTTVSTCPYFSDFPFITSAFSHNLSFSSFMLLDHKVVHVSGICMGADLLFPQTKIPQC